MCTQRNNNTLAEWPESTYRVRTATADPTPTQVDVNKSISAQDLKSLKKQDPFLYYSIPGVRDAAVRLEHADIDMYQVAQNGLSLSELQPRRASSIQASGTSSAAHKALV